ncbi:demethoxyubiquinone hydroxylase family protein [Janthinobacterium violaceinigrum]|uniref:Demethoxyubiquinone hydroxylase family protein n=1 Tax=Janthinobacterium violaceinigrum TaxID=2654252 RepID=A0A6I1I743_9BURK|nr:demethoxyubiquinone hydroxylase family protein [Janthinobacterium violaceinigrum]KAB8066824.1 demethoxyubiquinone hydroxylase family protein [Janthinobacterium violaceinigrum]
MDAKTQFSNRAMKVNHAGEQGAIGIYTGQIFMARWTASHLVQELRAIRVHEREHRTIFHDVLERRGLPRCRSYYLCATGGYVLGIVTGLCGARAISLTTVAVERVVLRHLRHQLAMLSDDDDASGAITAILRDEQEHHDQASIRTQDSGMFGRMLSAVVSGATESVIWLGMRL